MFGIIACEGPPPRRRRLRCGRKGSWFPSLVLVPPGEDEGHLPALPIARGRVRSPALTKSLPQVAKRMRRHASEAR